MDKAASDAVKTEIFDPTLLASTRSYTGMFDTDESSNIFKDLDEILIKQEENENGDEAVDDQSVAGAIEIKQEEIDYAPDEEDVENQLMHIDDQLIRLDENIEDITDHLDEQLLNTVTVENDALLSAEEENLLFSSMPEVMDLDQNWQLADPRDQEIEELIAAGLPSPLMPSPFMVAFDEEPKELTGENPVVNRKSKKK